MLYVISAASRCCRETRDETFDIQTQHAMNSQLAQLSGISGSRAALPSSVRSYSAITDSKSVRALLTHDSFILRSKSKRLKLIATHDSLPSLQVAENSDYRLPKKTQKRMSATKFAYG